MSSDENKAQDYLLDLKRISCKKSGKYKLNLELQASNSNYDLSQIKVENPSEFIDFEITDESLQNQVPLTGGEVKFHFPKGKISTVDGYWNYFVDQRFLHVPLQTFIILVIQFIFGIQIAV